jgi:hypothetical protein
MTEIYRNTWKEEKWESEKYERIVCALRIVKLEKLLHAKKDRRRKKWK